MKTTYKDFTIVYRRGHAATHFANKVWEFKSLSACKRWIDLLS